MVGIPNRGVGFYLSADIDGVDGSGLSVPSSAALSITGSIGLVARIAPDSWTGVLQGIISKSSTNSNQRSYRWGLLTDGTPVLRWSPDGGSTGTATATAAYTFTAGQAAWIGVTCDTVVGDVRFWTGGTGVTPTWVQHGASVASAFPGNFASTSPLLLGAGYVLTTADTREVLNGILYSAAVYNGVGANTSPVLGTKVFEVNGVFGPGNTFTSATAQAVTKLGGVTYVGQDKTLLEATNTGLIRLAGPCLWVPVASANTFTVPVTIEAGSDRMMRAEMWRNTTDTQSRIGTLVSIGANVTSAGAVSAVCTMSDTTTLTSAVSAAGATTPYQVDGWFQISVEWDQTAKALRVKLRKPGTPLSDDTGWTQIISTTSALSSGIAATTYVWNQNTNPHVGFRRLYVSGAVRANAVAITPHDIGRIVPGTTTWTAAATHTPVAVIMTLDRTAATIRVGVYSTMGTQLASVTASTTGQVGAVNTTPFQVLKNLPGWTSGFLWRKGVGIAPSTTAQGVLARQLLTTTYRPARATTSPALPLAPYVYGDRWKSSTTGAIQFYNGTAWVAA
jgi:hypothetical protein